LATGVCVGDGKVYLEPEDFGLDEVERFAIDFDEALAFFAVGDCCCWEGVNDLFRGRLIAYCGKGRGFFVPVFFLPKHCTI
jgi:hypothetical protein